MMKKTKMTSCIEKLAILLLVGICLTGCIGSVCASDDVKMQGYTDPMNYGTIHVYCNVDNASVVLHYHDRTRDYTSSFPKLNDYFHVFVELDKSRYTIDSLNVSADGYYPQNFTADEITLPTQKYEVVNMTVNLKPISAQSPVPILGIVSGIIIAGIFVSRLRYNRK